MSRHPTQGTAAETALTHHCRLSIETLHPRFGHVDRDGGYGRPTDFGEQMSGPPIGILDPGPVWHVSVMPRRAFYGPVMCRRRAEQALAGLGDPSRGEWHEWTGSAFHLRRRLSDVEQQQVGPVVDVRGTPEAARRAANLGDLLSLVSSQVVLDEIGDPS